MSGPLKQHFWEERTDWGVWPCLAWLCASFPWGPNHLSVIGSLCVCTNKIRLAKSWLALHSALHKASCHILIILFTSASELLSPWHLSHLKVQSYSASKTLRLLDLFIDLNHWYSTHFGLFVQLQSRSERNYIKSEPCSTTTASSVFVHARW